ncbi:MAG: cytochrome C oxidase subunit IV family protein [Gammaproteobacteria bacterium]|nr:cytochrome C oxidase subunit IV family protein [Gammaproteobacteria bacterium]
MATEGQQHPIKIYVLIWILLFVFSAVSYASDFLDDGVFRASVILLFMILKAAFIVAIFMHMKWERFALIFAILLPPLALLVLLTLMAIEADYAWATRVEYMGEPIAPEPNPPPTHQHKESGH